MCKYIESTHTYEHCKLQEENHDGSPNPLAGFFGRITNVLNRAPGEDHAPIANQIERHVVRERQIIQCMPALKDPNQQNRPADERHCANPTPVNAAPVTVGETEHRGDCTVCLAAEEAIKMALTRKSIVRSYMLRDCTDLISSRFLFNVDVNLVQEDRRMEVLKMSIMVTQDREEKSTKSKGKNPCRNLEQTCADHFIAATAFVCRWSYGKLFIAGVSRTLGIYNVKSIIITLLFTRCFRRPRPCLDRFIDPGFELPLRVLLFTLPLRNPFHISLKSRPMTAL